MAILTHCETVYIENLVAYLGSAIFIALVW